MFTSTEEHDLAARIKAGDLVAREALILANLALVVNIAKRYYSNGATLDDLIQEGNRGLIYAVDRYDPQTHNTRFSTYASYWISNMIYRTVVANFSLIRIPGYIFRMNALSQEVPDEPHAGNEIMHEDCVPIDLGPRMEISPRHRQLLKQAMISRVSYCVNDDDSDETDLDEALIGCCYPEDDLEAAEKLDALYEALAKLTKFERMIISYRFGLDDKSEKSMSYRRIARKLRVPFSRVQRIGNLALEKLRAFFRDYDSVHETVARFVG